jgi:cyclohexadienyl dehydratase
LSNLRQAMQTIGFLLLSVLFDIPPSPGRPLAAIKSDGVLKVGMTGDYAPFSLRGSDGQISGADVTMARELARELNASLVIVPTTWSALQHDLQEDRFDIAMGGVSVTPDRAVVGYFSIPVIRDGKRPIVRCADKDRYISIGSIDRRKPYADAREPAYRSGRRPLALSAVWARAAASRGRRKTAA